MIGQFILNILIWIDQGLNVILLGAPDETISSRTGRAMASKQPKWFVPPWAYVLDKVFLCWFRDDNHSNDSIEPETHREGEIWNWIKK